MELYQIHTKILTPFMNETLTALKTMASVEGRLGKAAVEGVNNFSFRGFAVAVVAKTYGSIEGKILMHYSDEVALKIGKRVLTAMLGEEPRDNIMTDDIKEAVTEFANTIIGLATGSLSQSNLQIKFTPPIFIHSNKDMDVLLDGVKQILTVPILVPDLGDFSFSYLLHRSVE
ncbi:MAG TPA: chemotaxis protein CheX [Gammaproteobacteria bacterium]